MRELSPAFGQELLARLALGIQLARPECHAQRREHIGVVGDELRISQQRCTQSFRIVLPCAARVHCAGCGYRGAEKEPQACARNRRLPHEASRHSKYCLHYLTALGRVDRLLDPVKGKGRDKFVKEESSLTEQLDKTRDELIRHAVSFNDAA
jgi:hypothetical protein